MAKVHETSMNIDSFYNFGSKLILATLSFSPTNLKKDEEKKLIKGEFEDINLPVVFAYNHGKKIRDMLDTGHPLLYLISDRFKEILEENHLTGWKSYSVNLFDKEGNEINGYHGISITGRCGDIDYNKCEIIEKKMSTGQVYKVYKGLYVGLNESDGTDFFLPGKSMKTIVTSRAAKLIKENKLTNVDLVNLADIETYDYAVRMLQS